jgi:hypothetical protein
VQDATVEVCSLSGLALAH